MPAWHTCASHSPHSTTGGAARLVGFPRLGKGTAKVAVPRAGGERKGARLPERAASWPAR
eukprot:7435516-Alexandrium_andersonii.AAC.1